MILLLDPFVTAEALSSVAAFGVPYAWQILAALSQETAPARPTVRALNQRTMFPSAIASDSSVIVTDPEAALLVTDPHSLFPGSAFFRTTQDWVSTRVKIGVPVLSGENDHLNVPLLTASFSYSSPGFPGTVAVHVLEAHADHPGFMFLPFFEYFLRLPRTRKVSVFSTVDVIA